MSSEMSSTPPSPAKLALIRRFLVANGTQARIDSGDFLQRYALPGTPLSMTVVDRPEEITFRECFEIPMQALLAAYEKHRHIWQEEFESHVDFEFEEVELAAIVDFLESPAGQHYREGCWRMDAYTETNTEHLVDEIIAEAEAVLRAAGPARPAE